MFGEKEIKKHNIEQQRHLMQMFGDDSIEKSMSKNEFEERFKTDHEVYDQSGLESFKKAIADEIGKSPESEKEIMEKAISSLSGLSKVLVKDETRIETFYVKKIETTEEEG